MPARAMSAKNNFSGTVTPNSSMRTKVNRDKLNISALAKKDGVTEQQVVDKVLAMSGDELIRYIQSKGEVPVSSFSGMCVQAALLRMEDISVISRSCNMPEYDALCHIEEAESEAVDNNTAQKQAILTPSTQACLQYVYKKITDDVNAATGTKGISTALDYIRKTCATPKNHNTPAVMSDNFNYNTAVRSNSFDIGSIFGAPTTDTSGVITTAPSGSLGGVYSSDPAPYTSVANPADNTSSIWSLIGNVVNNAGSIAKAAGSIGSTAVTTANGLNGVLNNLGGGIGASAITQYLTANWWKILLFLVIAAIIIILIFRAAKK